MGARVGEAVIGREHPAALLRAEVDRAVDSHGGFVLVTGEAGIGKTTLVTGAADEARRRGALVLSGSCWDSESAPGYWPWTQVVRGLRRTAPQEWAAAREAGGTGLGVLLGERRDEGAEAIEAFEIYDGVLAALVAISQRQPVVVVLDDLHWADPASLRLLAFAAQHAWFERVLLVGTYRDVEVDAADHPLQPLMTPLIAKATTVTLTGLGRDEVGTLIARTAGREPEPSLVDEVHRRTGGNPFFVEQTARLWRADGSVAAIAPGVRDAVRRRLSLLPDAVADLLGVAAVLGREFHRQVLAACAEVPAAQVDRLLDQALAARLVVSLSGGRFAFAHDLVRETLYDSLDDAARRRRHAAVIRAIDRSPALAERLVPGDQARHAYLADGEVPADRAVELLVAAARHAGARMSTEEATTHLRRAIEIADDPARRARVSLDLAGWLFHSRGRDEAWRLVEQAAVDARTVDDPEELVRVALAGHRHAGTRSRRRGMVDALIREAHRRMVGDGPSDRPPAALVDDLIASTERRAREGNDDEALAFSLWARHDSIWGLGSAGDREALTVEMVEVSRRTGDVDAELLATSLLWVLYLERSEPRYLDQLHTFVEMAKRNPLSRWHLAGDVDRSIVATLKGDFAEADELITAVQAHEDHDKDEGFGYMGLHVRWASALLQGRWEEAEGYLDAAVAFDHPFLPLVRAISAVERGDVAPALRHVTEMRALADPPYPPFAAPLWERLVAQVAAATGDPTLGSAARAALAPHRGNWVVSLYGSDISGPVDLWLAQVDAAQGRWDEAVEGFAAARDIADRVYARPWSLLARTGLAGALAARGDAAAAAELRAEVEREAAEIGMPHLVDRLSGTSAPPPRAGDEFRRAGDVWRLAYAGEVVHLPDAKGLQDLHELLSRPGTDVPAVDLLDPAAGPELTAARRMGGDPVLDDTAKAAYRRRLGDLDDAIDRAAARGDTSRAAAAEDERKALIAELRAAAGLAGRTRRLGDEAERARKTVTARIRDTLRKLDERHPALAAHLRDTVSTGATCRYAPLTPTTWRL